MPGISNTSYIRFGNEPIPSFLTDLNAMHEAEKVLTNTQWMFYKQNLRDIAPNNFDMDRGMIRATAAQRAEAFLRTIGLWQEQPQEQTA